MAREEITFYNEFKKLDSELLDGYISTMKSKHKKCKASVSLASGYVIYEIVSNINLADNNKSMASIGLFFEPPQRVLFNKKPDGEKFTCVYHIGFDRESDKHGFLKEMLKEKQFDRLDKQSCEFDIFEKVDEVDCNKSINDYIEKVKSLTTKFLDYIEYIIETED